MAFSKDRHRSSNNEKLVMRQSESFLELGEFHRLPRSGAVGVVGKDSGLLVVVDVVVCVLGPVARIEEVGIQLMRVAGAAGPELSEDGVVEPDRVVLRSIFSNGVEIGLSIRDGGPEPRV